MTKNYHYAIICSICCFLLLSASIFAEQLWPLKGTIDLSDGFGEFRQGHFHTGTDLRTGGRIGKKVYSPENGYLYRIKMSYYGSGKALYIKGDDGFIYVFYHLAKFNNEIEEMVIDSQFTDQRYYQDMYFEKDAVRIKKGDLVAFSGKTGIGAPHLHFEKRTADNIPINILTHGYNLDDNISPVFEKIFFKQVDDHSLFDNHQREISFELNHTGDSYTLDTTLYFNRPFGVLIDCFDLMRSQGMRQTVYSLEIYFDEKLYFETKFDSLNFDISRITELEYDYVKAVNKEDRVRTLYNKTGNGFSGSKSYITDGIFGLKGEEQIGIHQAKIVATDTEGNSSVLEFEFLWNPYNYLFNLDSVQIVDNRHRNFYFTPQEGFEKLKIDSVVAYLGRANVWGWLKDAETSFIDSKQVVCKVEANVIDKALIKLVVFANKDCAFSDNIFNGILDKGKPFVEIEHEIVDDGLIIYLEGKVRQGCQSRIDLYSNGKIIGREYPQILSMTRQSCFISPKPEYRHIDQIGATFVVDTTVDVRVFDSVNIFIVGLEDDENISLDRRLSFLFGENKFYKPRFIEINELFLPNSTIRRITSKIYQILPKAFVCKEDFDIKYEYPSQTKYNKKGGVCWLDEDKDSWVWLDNLYENNIITAKSTGGGIFAVVKDFEKPVISKLSYRNGKTYFNSTRNILFTAIDTLSGIDDDLDFKVELDGKWQLVEYDPENDHCKIEINEPLENGKHHLGIMVYDQAGNVGEQYLNFFVRDKRNIRKR
ncbi:MAG: M23 family metallopeptidase [candidate division Zixibacteria bacterium]|nr:M23 family metallopeptidase [candidate division Zixibacteria bacterium]